MELFEFVLRQCKAETRAARSVHEALNIIQTWTPHIFISDIGLPGEDGLSLMRKLRDDPRTKQLPGIAVSGYVSVQYETELKTAGYELALSKPVDPFDLVRKIRETLDRCS